MPKKAQSSRPKPDVSLPSQERFLRDAFEHLMEGLQIVDRDWRYLFVNEVAAQHGEKTVEDLLGQRMTDVYPGIETTEIFKKLKRCMSRGVAATLTSQFTYADGHRRWFELRVSPVEDGLCILSLDVTERILAAEHVQRLTRTLTVLSNVNQSIVRVRDLETLYARACQIAVEDGGFALAWIGLLDETGLKVRVAAHAGGSMGYLDRLEVSLGHQPAQSCPIERALRVGRYHVCDLTSLADGELAPCQTEALRQGFRSSASFPLYVDHQIRGAINLYTFEPDFFDSDEVRLLKEMTMDIGFAIEVAEGEQERVRAAQAVAEQAGRLEEAEQYTGLGSWEFDVRTGRGWWSRGMYRLFGLAERETVPTHEEYLALIHPEDRILVQDTLDRMAQGLDPVAYEFRPHPALGPDRCFQPRTRSLRDPESGAVLKFAGTLLDVTERKRDQATLRASEERLRTITRNAPDIISEVDREGRFLYISRVLPGFKLEDVVGRSFYDWVDPEFHAVMREALEQAFATGARQSYETQGAGAHREQRWYATNLSPVQSDGRVTSVILIASDVTERRLAERELANAQARLRRLQEADIIGLIVAGADGEIFEANDYYLDLLGYTRPELEQGLVRWLDITPPERLAADAGALAELEATGVCTPYEKEYFRKDGSRVWVLLTDAVLAEGSGKIIALVQDISDRKRAEQDLRVSEERYRTLVEQIPAIVYLDNIVDGVGRTIFVSPQVESILGVRVEDWLERGMEIWASHLHPDDREYAVSNYLRFVREGGDYNCEYRMVRDDGRVVWLRDQGVIIEGRPMRQMHGLIHDITASKQAEESLRQRVQELETLHTVSAVMRAAQTLEEALARLLDEALASLDTNAGAILLHYPASDDLRDVVTRGWFTDLQTVPIAVGVGVAGTVFSSGQSYCVDEFLRDELPAASSRSRMPAKWGGACVPIRSGEHAVGVLFVSMRLPRTITPEQMRLIESLSEIAGATIHRIRLHEETVQRLENLQALHEVDLAIASNFDLRPTLDTLISHTIHQLGVDAADILLLHPSLQVLEFAAGQGFRTLVSRSLSVRIGESGAGRAALEHRSIYISSLAEVEQNSAVAALWKSEEFASYFCAPLIVKGDVKGVLEVYSRAPLPPHPDWMYYLETLAGQAAIAIDNTQLFENLQRANLELGVAYEATIEGWSRALDLRDEETEDHTRRVADLTLELAAHFGFTPAELPAIRRGAILHDIGKIGVPDTILLKPGSLTDAEWVVMRGHPQLAYELLHPIHYLHDSLDIPYCHHEKWDGTGYPRRLRGESIPLTARIFAVVDMYDALTSDRPYRKAWTHERALEHIRSLGGSHFDPRVVEVFLRNFSSR